MNPEGNLAETESTSPETSILQGDCLDALRGMGTASVDAVVTDPPYELAFMGKAWDAEGTAHSVVLWREVLRVLKPGGHLLAFGGSRTYHRMACAIEDAGFEVRDSLMWLYGTGFPKSLNVGKALDAANGVARQVVGSRVADDIRGGNMHATNRGRRHEIAITKGSSPWEGWGTALKPGHEPIVMARKPLIGTVAANVAAYGTGGLNIDGCRIGTDDKLVRPFIQRDDNEVFGKGLGAGTQTEPGGRWPANVLLDEEAAAELDAQSGVTKSSVGQKNKHRSASVATGTPNQDDRVVGHADSGGASRFFYVAKPSKRERGAGNNHPTVKPVALMRWLCRLVTPPGGLVLDPFMGSGTTGIAALREGFRFAGIEREPEYVAIAKGRLAEVA